MEEKLVGDMYIVHVDDHQKLWSFEKIEKEDVIGVSMTMHSPDGEENYPGEMTVGYDEGSFI